MRIFWRTVSRLHAADRSALAALKVEDAGDQRSGDRGQRTEDRGQKAEEPFVIPGKRGIGEGLKTSFLLAAVGFLAMLTITGCANQQSSPPAVTGTNPTARTYTGEDLKKTGHPQTGAALEAVDPSVQVPGGR